MRARCLAGVIAVAALTVAGCAKGSSGPAPTPAPTTPATSAPAVGAEIKVGGMTTTYHGTEDVAGTGKSSIQIEDYYFEPTVLKGKPGQQLVLTLENESQSPHTFTTADGRADVEVKPGGLAEARITLPQSGNLAFFCRFYKDRGMAGVFNVSGPIESPGATTSPTTSPRPQTT